MSSEIGNFDEMFQPRATERFGGRAAVGSALWLEHVESIGYVDEAGNQKVLTPEDLASDEIHESAQGWPRTGLDRLYSQDVELVTKESWLRRTFLPTLPVKIAGDKTDSPVKFESELSVFTVPRSLARYSGVVAEERVVLEDGEVVRDLNEEASVALSLRLVPTQGRVDSISVYPGSTDTRYGITAVEFEPSVIRLAIGYQKYLELYREPQTKELPELIAPHQF